MSNMKLKEFIKAIRNCRTAKDERGVVAKESALIRNAFKEKNPKNRHRNIAKLLFVNLLGYPTQFGQVETIKLVASADYTEKRIGYMALSQLMNESSELLMMITQAVKNDLNSTTSNFIVALALTSIAEVSTEDMCRELYTEVKKLMKSTSSYIKKKAIISAVRIIRNIPDTIDDFMEVIDTLINEHSHSITLATMTLIEEIIKIEPDRVKQLRKYSKIMIKILKNLIHSGYAPEYDILRIKDQIVFYGIIMLGFLCEGNAEVSDEMNIISKNLYQT